MKGAGGTYGEDGAAEAVSAAGSEESQEDGEDHDGQSQGETTNTSLPGVRVHVVVLAQELSLQLLQAGNTLALEYLETKI